MTFLPFLYPLIYSGGLGPPNWYDPTNDPFLAYDRVACREQTRYVEGCDLKPEDREASEERYFEAPRADRHSWWLDGPSKRQRPTTSEDDR